LYIQKKDNKDDHSALDARDGLIDPCGVGLDSGELLLVVSDGLDHGHDVASGYDGDAFCYDKGFGSVVNNQFSSDPKFLICND
jgi:hypothetical protein